MSAKHDGGLSATNEYVKSPFAIYRNALDFVMSSLSLDEDAAAEVILNEMGGYANDWQKFGIQSAAGQIKAARLRLWTIDWGQAWLN